MMRRRRHGGSRAGSGRKRRSETLGPPQGHSITNYFTSPTRANTAAPNRTDNTPELPVQNPATATTATNVTTKTPPDQIQPQHTILMQQQLKPINTIVLIVMLHFFNYFPLEF